MLLKNLRTLCAVALLCGCGVVTAQEGNKLEIEFETAGAKRVIDSFVKLPE